MEKAKVYFTKEIISQAMIKLYETLGVTLQGNVAVKLYSGEEENQNFLRPEFVKEMVDYVKGTVVEWNTAYEGARYTTEDHKKLMVKHGWSKYFNVDIMDAEGPDKVLEIPDGFKIKKDYVGKNIDKYDSMLVISHFKGHPMGGYGGALKQLSIGVASKYGKAYIHGAVKPEDLWTVDHDSFLESMADAAYVVHNHFKGNVVYINVMKNMSVDCDCCAVAEDPCLQDMGILISTDPIAIDKGCLDMVENSNDPGKAHFMERVNSRNGKHTIETALRHGFGTTNYELIDIDTI